jgi:hypothetical protein
MWPITWLLAVSSMTPESWSQPTDSLFLTSAIDALMGISYV